MVCNYGIQYVWVELAVHVKISYTPTIIAYIATFTARVLQLLVDTEI